MKGLWQFSMKNRLKAVITPMMPQPEAEENNSIGVKLLRDMQVCDDVTGIPGKTGISDRAGRLNNFEGVNEIPAIPGRHLTC
jgi:hypothetical protein